MSKPCVVIVSGAPEGRNLKEITLEVGATAGDVIRSLGLNGYLLSLEGSAQAFASEEVIYDKVSEGGKFRASPIAEVGIA